VVIDRFEDNYAVCEQQDKSIINIKQILIPIEAKVGDVLNIEGNYISIDTKETRNRKNVIDAIVKKLWE
jgi:hypothetical protein